MQPWEPLPFSVAQAGERLGPRPLEYLLFESPVARIGAFRAFPSQAGFADSGPIQRTLFVVPRRAVRIRHEGRSGFVADPNHASFYNRGQVYRREAVDGEGDHCNWFAVAPAPLRDALRERDGCAADDADRPFRFESGPCDRRSYVLAQLAVRHLIESAAPDALFVEEATLEVLDRLLAGATRTAAERTHQRDAHRDLVEAAKGVLGSSYAAASSLASTAQALGVSVFHLSRTFRRLTGLTLHAYRDQLRLRAALERVPGSRCALTGVALDLGYSSHSHFSAAFSRSFGATPSQWRATASRERARELCARLAL